MPPRRGISSRTAELLNQDKSSGYPIPFRRIPGTNQYENPRTGEIRSRYYVEQVYLPQLEEGERLYLRRAVTRKEGTAARYGYTLVQSYGIKKAADGDPVTSSNQQDKQVEFNNLYTALRQENNRVKRLDLSQTDARINATAPQSALARLLVALGRRLPSDTHPVGTSPVGYATIVMQELMARAEALGIPVDETTIPPPGSGLINAGVDIAEEAAERAAARAEAIAEARERRLRGY